ncbi:MAG TPA: hypothetical protein VFY84_20395, partial [Jiangellales bacterium]|nr:hypothetical protein [Jiangellales bacterium]
ATTVTGYTVPIYGDTRVYLPNRPVTAVLQVRVNGVVVTGWTLIGGVLYHASGFGALGSFPPDVLAVDYTHGYTTVPDDVKKAVLKLAADEYDNPTRVQSESIDDYVVRYDPANKIDPGFESPETVAARYRGVVFA